MKRNIFNGWHTNLGKMFYHSELSKIQLTLDCFDKGFINVSSHMELSGFYEYIIPLQYIGVSDKNGQMIFENDILKCAADVNLWVVFYNHKNCSYMLSNLENESIIKPILDSDIYCLYTIVSNTYEYKKEDK